MLYTGGVKSWSVISALKELGVQVVGVGTNKSTEDDVRRIADRVGDDTEYIPEGGAGRILKTVRERKADIMIAGGRNMYVAMKEQIPFIDINQERHKAYAGYEGLLRLAKELTYSLANPIWKLASSPAPWDKEARPMTVNRRKSPPRSIRSRLANRWGLFWPFKAATAPCR